MTFHFTGKHFEEVNFETSLWFVVFFFSKIPRTQLTDFVKTWPSKSRTEQSGNLNKGAHRKLSKAAVST